MIEKDGFLLATLRYIMRYHPKEGDEMCKMKEITEALNIIDAKAHEDALALYDKFEAIAKLYDLPVGGERTTEEVLKTMCTTIGHDISTYPNLEDKTTKKHWQDRLSKLNKTQLDLYMNNVTWKPMQILIGEEIDRKNVLAGVEIQ